MSQRMPHGVLLKAPTISYMLMILSNSSWKRLEARDGGKRKAKDTVCIQMVG